MLRIISFERQNGVFSGIVNLFKTAKLVEFYNQHTLPPTILYHRTTKLGLCEESNLLLNEARGEGGGGSGRGGGGEGRGRGRER